MAKYDGSFEKAWEELLSAIRNDLEKRQVEVRNLEEEVQVLERIRNLVEEKNIMGILGVKGDFEKYFPSLVDIFPILEEYQKRGWLENSALSEYVNHNIISKLPDIQSRIVNSVSLLNEAKKTVVGLKAKSDELDHNPSPEIIKELAERYQLSVKDLLLYCFARKMEQELSHLKNNKDVVPEKDLVVSEEKNIHLGSDELIDDDMELKEHSTFGNTHIEKIKKHTVSKERYQELKEQFTALEDHCRLILDDCLSTVKDESRFTNEKREKIMGFVSQILELRKSVIEKMNPDSYYKLKKDELLAVEDDLKLLTLYCKKLEKLYMQNDQNSEDSKVVVEDKENVEVPLRANDEILKNQKKFEKLEQDYEELGTQYGDLLDECYQYLSVQPYHQLKVFNDYSKQGTDELEELFHEMPDLEVPVRAAKIFKLRQEIEDLKQQIMAENYADTGLVDLFKYAVSEFHDSLELLKNIYSKPDLDGELGKSEEKVTDLYFLLDDKEEVVGVDKDLMETLRKISTFTLFNKDNAYASLSLSNKRVLFRRVSNYLISLIPVDVEPGKNPKLLILTGDSIKSDGIIRVVSETKKIVDNYNVLIDDQMDLIRNGDSHYLELQDRLIGNLQGVRI